MWSFLCFFNAFSDTREILHSVQGKSLVSSCVSLCLFNSAGPRSLRPQRLHLKRPACFFQQEFAAMAVLNILMHWVHLNTLAKESLWWLCSWSLKFALIRKSFPQIPHFNSELPWCVSWWSKTSFFLQIFNWHSSQKVCFEMWTSNSLKEYFTILQVSHVMCSLFVCFFMCWSKHQGRVKCRWQIEHGKRFFSVRLAFPRWNSKMCFSRL